MGKLLHAGVTGQVLGAAFAVHGTLGPEFLESVYENALARELEPRGVPCQRQVQVPIYYKGVQVGEHFLDLLVADRVIVELKAVRELARVHMAVVLSYLTATGLPVAMLVNFGRESLEFKRVVRETAPRGGSRQAVW